MTNQYYLTFDITGNATYCTSDLYTNPGPTCCLDELTDLPLIAANVNLSFNVNTTDALLVYKRFLGLINAFTAADWIFEEPQTTLSGGQDVILDIKVLCSGDVNRSYIPVQEF